MGVDTALRTSGIAVIKGSKSKAAPLAFGLIKNRAGDSHTTCLRQIYRQVSDSIERYSPDAVAIEGCFFLKNARTSLILGEARGAVLTACAEADLDVYEYAPRVIKRSVTGNGRAPKDQVARMVEAMLGLDRQPAEDAADALATALCHLHQMFLPQGIRSEPL